MTRGVTRGWRAATRSRDGADGSATAFTEIVAAAGWDGVDEEDAGAAVIVDEVCLDQSVSTLRAKVMGSSGQG